MRLSRTSAHAARAVSIWRRPRPRQVLRNARRSWPARLSCDSLRPAREAVRMFAAKCQRRDLGVAPQANHRGNIQIKFPKRFGQSIRGPILLLARDARAGTEISD